MHYLLFYEKTPDHAAREIPLRGPTALTSTPRSIAASCSWPDRSATPTTARRC